MKKDRRDIRVRIQEFGITNVHVGKMIEKHPTTIARVITGDNKNKETIDLIHEFLDLVKTRFVKKNGKWVELK